MLDDPLREIVVTSALSQVPNIMIVADCVLARMLEIFGLFINDCRRADVGRNCTASLRAFQLS